MKCVFCGDEIRLQDGTSNSTWPVFMDKDAERHRCCNTCNFKYVIACRVDKTLIMRVRNMFNIEYEGDVLLSAGKFQNV